MKQAACSLKLSIAILFVMLGFCANLPGVYAQDNRNTITFDNQSEEQALVKLIGQTSQTIEVPNAKSRTVNVAAGEYYILVRYSSEPDQYSYSKGDAFTVTQTATQYSAISITLHKVVRGNYPIHPTSREEFDKIAVTEQKTVADETKGTLAGKATVFVRLDATGKIIERQSLESKAKFVGSIVEGKLVGKFVVPEGEKNGLLIVEDPLPKKNPERENKYRRGHRYIPLKDVGKKDAKYYRAIWLQQGDYFCTVPGRLVMALSHDVPGTIYRKGSIIDGQPISRDMTLTTKGKLEPISSMPQK